MTAWYCRGKTGEYILDQVENVINGFAEVDDFVQRMTVLGLDYKEIQTLLLTEELVEELR